MTGAQAEELKEENTGLKKIIQKLKFDLEESKIREKVLSEQSMLTGNRHKNLSDKLENEMDQKNKMKLDLEKLKIERARFEKDFRKADTENKDLLSRLHEHEDRSSQEVSHLQNEIRNLKRNLTMKDKEIKRLNSTVIAHTPFVISSECLSFYMNF